MYLPNNAKTNDQLFLHPLKGWITQLLYRLNAFLVQSKYKKSFNSNKYKLR